MSDNYKSVLIPLTFSQHTEMFQNVSSMQVIWFILYKAELVQITMN